MKTTDTHWFDYETILTESDILAIAKEIGEIRKKIDEIEEARKKLKDHQNKIVHLSRQLEQGKIKGNFYGKHSFHDPVENMVTISPDETVNWKYNEFPVFTREMTQYEKEKYCQHTIDFKESEVTDWDVTDETAEQLYLGTDKGDEDSFKDRPGFEEFHMKGDYYIKAPDSFSSAMVWTVFQHCGSGVYPEGMGTFYRESDAIKKVRELRHNDLQEVKKELQEKRKEAEALQEQTTPDTPAEPEQLSTVSVYKALTGDYYTIDEQDNCVPLKVLNSLENVVFFEQEGVDGVILKRHSEIIPGVELE